MELLLVSILIIELLLIVILTWIAMFLLASRNRSIATLRSIECALMSLQSICAVKNSSLDKEEAGSIQETSNEGANKRLWLELREGITQSTGKIDLSRLKWVKSKFKP